MTASSVRVSRVPLRGREGHARGFGTVGHLLDASSHHQADRRLRAHRIEKNALQVGPVRHPIGCAVTLAHEGPERDGADFAAGGDGANGDAIGLAGDAPERIAKTEVEEDAARIRRELETGAPFGKAGSALDEGHPVALAGERQRGRQSADAGSDDGKREARHVFKERGPRRAPPPTRIQGASPGRRRACDRI